MSGVNVTSHRQAAAGAGPGDGPLARGERRGAAAAPESPPAAHPPGRTWKDPRLLVGVALVAGCVLLGARLLASADDTVAVWALRRDLATGSEVTTADLQRQDLRFGSRELAARYLPADLSVPDGMVVTREVAAGELLPRAALSRGDRGELLEVPVAVGSEAVPATLRAGELVDVWVTPEPTDGEVPRADRVLEGVRVVALPADGSGLGPSTTRQILVGLPSDQQTRLGEALARLSTGTPVVVRRD